MKNLILPEVVVKLAVFFSCNQELNYKANTLHVHQLPRNFKKKSLNYSDKGVSMNKISKTFGVAYGTVYNYRSKNK